LTGIASGVVHGRLEEHAALHELGDRVALRSSIHPSGAIDTRRQRRVAADALLADRRL